MVRFYLFTSSPSGHPRFWLMLALAVSVAVSVGLAACSRKIADPITGVWQAVVLNKAGEEVAFKLEVKHEGDQVIGALVNGGQRADLTGNGKK